MYTLAIVDDEIELREGLVNHFPWEKHGFKVLASFGSGQEMLNWIDGNSVDVILTDIRMPFMSGLELIHSIKESRGDSILFCLLSAHKDFGYAKEGIHLGVRHYLVKPTSFEEIEEAFSKIREELDSRLPEAMSFEGVDNLSIKKAMTIIHQNPSTVSLQSLADSLSLNAAYLSRLFKDETGENFSSVLTRVRMEKAADLLTSKSTYTNREISEILGYQDPQNFCRMFRRYYDMTPRSYRKKNLE